MIWERLFKDFKAAIEEEIVGEDQLTDHLRLYPLSPTGFPLVLKDYIKLMHSLGFVQINRVSASEEKLLTDLWNLTGGTEENDVDASHLLVLLAGLMNLDIPQILKSPGEEERSSFKTLGNLHMSKDNRKVFFVDP